MNEVILIRHAEVVATWKTVCYGAMDVPLSDIGASASREFARHLAEDWTPTHIFHSGLSRTERLATWVGERFPGVPVTVDERLRERNYGEWQGRSWDEAYASDPDNFHGLVDHPDTYRPPTGETTTEMQRRIVDWYREVVGGPGEKRVIALTHSGPIAALAGHLASVPANAWQPWMVSYLGVIRIREGIPTVFPG